MNPKQDFNTILEQISNAFNAIPFNRMLGLRLNHIGEDFTSMSFDMKNELIGNYLYGILHGGVISSVLDMAGGVAIMVSAIKKHPNKTFEELVALLGKASTVSLQVNFIRPGKGEHFTAKAWVLHSGNKLSFARMELFNNEETLISSGSGTYLTG